MKSHDPEPDNRDAVMASLIEAVDNGRSRTAIRHWLDRAEAATADGATEEETGQIQRAVDALLLLERGVGLPPPLPFSWLRNGATGLRLRYDFPPLLLMIRGVVSPGPEASTDR
ncbi:hypothetical protein ACIOMM_36520 [Streptomyces sp. NPDC087908]|uniref:hypothetical protein n=1 Tax=Streptomyces sp. NPDC087908 TaxID=3365820 RepID=UPI0038180BF1